MWGQPQCKGEVLCSPDLGFQILTYRRLLIYCRIAPKKWITSPNSPWNLRRSTWLRWRNKCSNVGKHGKIGVCRVCTERRAYRTPGVQNAVFTPPHSLHPRIKHLEKFQQTILEEIETFEKDSKALKQMEKEFTVRFCLIKFFNLFLPAAEKSNGFLHIHKGWCSR